MTFENPAALWLIPAAALFLSVLGIWGWHTKRGLVRFFHLNPSRVRLSLLGKLLGAGLLLGLLAVALAGPRLPHAIVPVPGRTGEVVLLVDVSTSMAARKDLSSPSALDRAKPILHGMVDHLQELGGVRLALFGFTNKARSHVPFVTKEDYPYLKASIDKVLDVHSTPGSSSTFGRPIMDVAAKFSPGPQVKLIVLVSDGEAMVGLTRGVRGTQRDHLEQAITQANLAGIRVITVGVGEAQGARIPVTDAEGMPTGEHVMFDDTDMVFYLTKADLREISERTGGRYFDQDDRRGLIQYIEANLAAAPLEAVAGSATEYRPVARWLLVACLPIWALLARRYLVR